MVIISYRLAFSTPLQIAMSLWRRKGCGRSMHCVVTVPRIFSVSKTSEYLCFPFISMSDRTRESEVRDATCQCTMPNINTFQVLKFSNLRSSVARQMFQNSCQSLKMQRIGNRRKKKKGTKYFPTVPFSSKSPFFRQKTSGQFSVSSYPSQWEEKVISVIQF